MAVGSAPRTVEPERRGSGVGAPEVALGEADIA